MSGSKYSMTTKLESLHKENSKELQISKVSVHRENISMKRSCSSALCTQVGVSFAVSLMQLLGGVIVGYPGIVLPSLTDPDSQDIFLNPQQVPFFASTAMIGCTIGNLICGPISIKYGQRLTMLIFMPMGLSGWLFCYFSKAYWSLLVSRFALGVFASVCFTNASIFIAETVHCSLRGRLVAFCDISRQIGFLFLYSVGSSDLDWRTVGLVCGVIPAVFPCAVLLFVPNSPRWTAVKGRPEEEVIRCLRYFREENYDLKMELNEIKEDVQGIKSGSTILQQLELLRKKSMLKLMVFLIYFHVAFAFTGNTLVVTYTASIFQSTGTGLGIYMSTILIGAVRVISNLVYACASDSFGRRPMFLISCSLATLSMGALGLFFYLKHIGYDTSPIYWLPLASVISFTFFTNIYNPIMDLMRSELLPNCIRILGTSIIAVVMYLSFFLNLLTYPMIVAGIGHHWAFWIYTINTLVMLVVMYFFLPETKGKSLEEIAKLF